MHRDPSSATPLEELIDAEEFFAVALTRVDPDKLAFVSVPAPAAPLTVFLGTGPIDRSFCWHPPAGTAWAGHGVAAAIDVAGPNRIAELSTRLAKLWSEIARFSPDELSNVPLPRVLGGLAFQPGNATAPPWDTFGDGSFTLPRWSYSCLGHNAFLSLAVRGRDVAEITARHRVLSELEQILDVLRGAIGPTVLRPPPRNPPVLRSALRPMPFAEWKDYFATIKDAIHANDFSKIVGARCTEVELPYEMSPLDVFSRLTASRTCTGFVLRRDQASFVGASPELLFAKEGQTLTTEALAGTIRSLGSEFPTESQQSRRLQASAKEAVEHALVVSHIQAQLEPICEELSHPDHPDVRKFRAIIHLNTPFHARLRAGTTATEILERLHPTPAVGGLPARDAASWIAAHEKVQRGWYAGPVGWIDSTGDATFAVAIRSGVVTRTRGYVYGGAGIVAEASADAEYAETELKQVPFFQALEVEGT